MKIFAILIMNVAMLLGGCAPDPKIIQVHEGFDLVGQSSSCVAVFEASSCKGEDFTEGQVFARDCAATEKAKLFQCDCERYLCSINIRE